MNRLLPTDDFNTPRNPQQIYNAKSREQNSSLGPNTKVKNYADEITEVINLLNKHCFVQKIIFIQNKPPSIILFCREQILEIKIFFCTHRTVLCIDKTFNLGKVYVTCLVYKNVTVISKRSGGHPIFLGPLFLHNDSSTATYKEFFNCIATVLYTSFENLVIQ